MTEWLTFETSICSSTTSKLIKVICNLTSKQCPHQLSFRTAWPEVPQRLSLKVGAQVIHLCNDPAMGLVNGHRGCVEACLRLAKKTESVGGWNIRCTYHNCGKCHPKIVVQWGVLLIFRWLFLFLFVLPCHISWSSYGHGYIQQGVILHEVWVRGVGKLQRGRSFSRIVDSIGTIIPFAHTFV